MQNNEIVLSEIDELLGLITTCRAAASVVAMNIARDIGGREIALAITKLQEAQSWCHLAQDELKPGTIAEQTKENE